MTDSGDGCPVLPELDLWEDAYACYVADRNVELDALIEELEEEDRRAEETQASASDNDDAMER